MWGLVKGDLASIWAPAPLAPPARQVVAYLCAIVLAGAGGGLLWRRTGAMASRVLAAGFVAWLLLVRVPFLVFEPSMGMVWAAGKTAVMAAAAWVVADSCRGLPRVAVGEP